MARLNPARRRALKEARRIAYAERLRRDCLSLASVHSHGVNSVMTKLEPVGKPKPNSKGWEFGKAPKGSFKANAAGAKPVKFGIVTERKRESHKRFSRA